VADTRQRLGYRPGLDGVRALAVVAVMVVHTGIKGTGGGGFGVDMFFALSGFLITSLLVEEFAGRNRVSFGNFYARRALRLLPALFLVLAVFGTIAHFTAGYEARRTVAGILPALFYVINWFSIWHYFGGLHHTWSLAIEEQFYLLWPPILVLLLRKRLPARTLAWIVFAAAMVMFASRLTGRAMGLSEAALYNALPFRLDALLLGATAALVPALLKRYSSRNWGIVGFLIAGGTIIFPIVRVRSAVGSTVVAAATCLIIAHIMYGPATSFINRFLDLKPLVWTGRRSYGLYLWHWPIFLFMHVEQHLSRAPAAFVVSFVVAAASAKFVEFPFLRLKKRFGRTDVPAAVPL
jgi:peptidoglycan/LPS O-acetylase OafA/YrhL